MLKKILSRLNTKKVKVFLLFLSCSILAWTISKLSQSYESRAVFELNYTAFPDSLLLNTKNKEFAVAKLRASGFQFLGYSFNQKEIKVDLRKVNKTNNDYFLTETELKTQFERQLPNSVSLLELEKDRYFVNLYKVETKEVPIKPAVTLKVAPNHILDGFLKLVPETVTLKGPTKELAQIHEVLTVPLVLNDLLDNFTEELKLLKPDTIENTIFLQETVKVSGVIEEFSERAFEIPINAVNVPVGYRIKTFPNTVKLVCKASVDELKAMTASDFEALVNYKPSANLKSLAVELHRKPEHIYSVQLLTNQVEFVLEKL